MIPLFLLPQALEFQACATTQLKTRFLEGFIYTLFSLQFFLSLKKKRLSVKVFSLSFFGVLRVGVGMGLQGLREIWLVSLKI